MKVNLQGKLIVAISSRALFDLSESNQVWEEQGELAYQQYQIDNEDNILQPGPAFPIVKKLLGLKQANQQESLVEVILLSRNSADTGLRIFNSIQSHQLNISRAAFTRGQSPYGYARAFGAHLFLSANIQDVQNAIDHGIAAATMVSATPFNTLSNQLRIAFDGDAVIFSDEAERIFQHHDLKTFQQTEQACAKTPLGDGPFKLFLETLHQLQQTFNPDDCPIRTALITARNAPAHERAIRTLRAWNIRTDEAIFLGGMEKTLFLKEFGADIFFDDQTTHCEKASQVVATGHVPHGVVNELL
ncbi:MAG: 5'-nucleotidase [Legionellales bacterium]|nr:5'-nucleotidase [Legionellales bacterium]